MTFEKLLQKSHNISLHKTDFWDSPFRHFIIWIRVRVRNYGRWSDLGGKNICLVKWFNINLWPIFVLASFLTWSLRCNFYSNFYNTTCWYSGKDSGLSPRRPQFKSHSQQAFLQKDFPWKFFKKWLSPVWKLFEGYFKIHYS